MKTLATDLDGTLYLDNVLINGVQSAYNSLISNNFQIFHTTNNSSQSTDIIATKLSNLLSIDIDIESIVTPLVVLKEFLKNKNYSLYVYGSKEIKDFVSSITNTVKEIDNCDFIIAVNITRGVENQPDPSKIFEINHSAYSACANLFVLITFISLRPSLVIK